jgi:hypothetical protein
MIREGKLIKISPDDHPVLVKIKNRFNDIVINDDIVRNTFMGKKCDSHTAWRRVDKTLIWLNQLRIKHWYFETISGTMYKAV